MPYFFFELEFSLPDSCWNLDDVLDRVWAASGANLSSCLAGPGRLLLDFAVEAPTFEQATALSVAQITSAVSIAKFIPRIPPPASQPPVESFL